MENISITNELIPTEQFSFNDDSPLEYLQHTLWLTKLNVNLLEL